MRKIINVSGTLTKEYGRQICKEIYSWLPSKVTENTLEIKLDSQEGDFEVFLMIKQRLEELKSYFKHIKIITKAVNDLSGPAAWILLLGDQRIFEKEPTLLLKKPYLNKEDVNQYMLHQKEKQLFEEAFSLLRKITRIKETILINRLEAGWLISKYAGINCSIYTKYCISSSDK